MPQIPVIQRQPSTTGDYPQSGIRGVPSLLPEIAEAGRAIQYAGHQYAQAQEELRRADIQAETEAALNALRRSTADSLDTLRNGSPEAATEPTDGISASPEWADPMAAFSEDVNARIRRGENMTGDLQGPPLADPPLLPVLAGPTTPAPAKPTVPRPGPDPVTYVERVEREIDRLGTSLAGSLRHPESKRAFTLALERYKTQQVVSARAEALKIQHAQIVMLDGLLMRQDATDAVFAPTTDMRQAAVRRGTERIQARVGAGVISGERGRELLEGFLKDVGRGEVLRDFNNPEMQGAVIDSLLTGKRPEIGGPDEQLALAHTLTERREAAGKKAAEAAERQRQVQLTHLSQLAFERDLTAADVVKARDLGYIVNRTEFEHFMTLATTPPKERPSDPAIESAVRGGVWSGDPAYTEQAILGWMAAHRAGAPGLSPNDGQQALAEIQRRREHRQTLGESAASRDYQRNKEAYTLARDEGFRALGVTTPFTQLDGPAALLVSDFERQFNARVLDARGNVARPPREVLYELLPIFQARQSDEAKATYRDRASTVGRTLGTQVPDPLDDAGWSAWFPQQAQKVEALRNQNPNLYQLQRQTLEALKEQREAVRQAEQRKASTPQTRNYRPPATVQPR